MNLTELKKAAEAAKKQSDWYEYQKCCDMEVINIEDQKFIALANPATILKLIAVAEDMQELTKPDRRGSYQWFRDFAAKSLKELES
jgi:hypothetical protein